MSKTLSARLFFVLLLFGTVFFLTGCGNSGSSGDKPPSYSPARVLTPEAPGKQTLGSSPLILDISNQDQGYLTAESDSDEAYILSAFNDFLKDFHTLIHFNGDAFDIPFITERAAHLNVSLDLSHLESLDLYKTARKCKSILSLSDYKQKTIEHFLGIEREDMYSGGELIDIYRKFAAKPSDTAHNEYRKLLLLHNHDDIEGMLSLLPLVSYYAIIMNSYTVDNAVIDKDTDSDGNVSLRLIAECSLPVGVPVDRHICIDNIHILIKNRTLTLVIPVISDTLKYFFKDYKNYFYLTSEDEAIHKSIAQYVDSNNRVKCSASNCYTKKTGIFLPLYDNCDLNIFKKDYSDPEKYCNADDILLKSTDNTEKYIHSVINHIFS